MSPPSPAILALHGNLGSPEDWDLPGLPDLRVIDLWDHVDLPFDAFAKALAGPLSEGLQTPILAGYSLGGRLALHALAAEPGRWSGAVLLSAHPGLTRVEDRLDRHRADATWSERARTGEWEDFLDLWNAQPVFGAVSESLQFRQRRLVSRRTEMAKAFLNWSLSRQEDLREVLARFEAPVLWISGENDERFTRIGAEMVEVFPVFRHVIVPGCGHRVLAEGGDALVREIAGFVGEIQSSRTVP
mgnify:CR=1 FL=1